MKCKYMGSIIYDECLGFVHIIYKYFLKNIKPLGHIYLDNQSMIFVAEMEIKT